MLMPLIATFFGVLLFMIGVMRERNTGTKSIWKWGGCVVCLIGLYATWPYFSSYVGNSVLSAMYRDAANGRRMLIGHWTGFLVPVLGIVGCVVVNIFHTRAQREMED